MQGRRGGGKGSKGKCIAHAYSNSFFFFYLFDENFSSVALVYKNLLPSYFWTSSEGIDPCVAIYLVYLWVEKMSGVS